VLDADALARLVGHDPSLLAAIRSDFASAARATASELERAVAGGDWHAASAVAHRLNGSSQSVGAMQLAYLCARIEAAGRRGAGAEVVAAQAQFGDAVQAVLDRLAGTDADHAAAPDILLVDDDPLQLRLIRQQLLHLGLTGIQTAGSGADALALLRNRDSSRLLLLLDLNMDGMDGIELMRELADTGFAGALALVSAADERVLESGARLAGEHRLNLVGHLHKPVLPQTLGALIGRWRDSGAAAPRPARRPEKQYTAVDLQRALAQRQFFLVFQPKVCLADDRLDGVEALVRWQHPIDGVVFPDHFIELAEDAGLIDALTDQVLELAVRQAAQWGADGPVPNIAINVSMENLVRLDFPERVLGLLARHGVEPKRLQIEVTESRLLADARAPLDILTRLRMHHVELAIDDFGIGHSSLAQLRDLPFSELKIDRSFVHGCREHPTQRAIVAASTEMARRLGMRTVAEGIGDADDLEAARDAGCDIAQGFYIGAPMSAEGLERWIRGRDNRRPPASTFSTRREHQRRPATAAPIR
jgi:EAL domain-containing protein (putative c-di-GMP-specific phosphodiesterase class I)/HPt (histidine-containing phosphotransfer) domain-containing protein